jgi:hypothetical protein
VGGKVEVMNARLNAFLKGQTDAVRGRVYRHSADKGSAVRRWELDAYDRGWHSGRAMLDAIERHWL